MHPSYLAWSAQLRRDNNAREFKVYRGLAEDVRLLRRRGFGVHAEGRKFRVGNRLMGARELSATAARERRLMEPARAPHPDDQA